MRREIERARRRWRAAQDARAAKRKPSGHRTTAHRPDIGRSAVSSGEQSLASYLRVDPTLSNEAAVALWIENNLQVLDVEVAEAVFGVLCSRFERCLSYVPQHMHGGAL